MATAVKRITLPVPVKARVKLDAPGFNSYGFQTLGAPDFGGFYGNRLPGVEHSAVNGIADAGPVIEFFAANLWAAVLYTVIIIGCSYYRGQKLYHKRQDAAKTQFVNNALILKKLTQVDETEKMTDAVYNIAQRNKIDLYNQMIIEVMHDKAFMASKNIPIQKDKTLPGQPRYENFKLACPEEITELRIKQDDFTMEVDVFEEEYVAVPTSGGSSKIRKKKKGDETLLEKFYSSFAYRKILWPAYKSLILAAFSYWIVCISLAVFTGTIGYIAPWLLIIPAIPALVYLGIYHFRDVDYKKTHREEVQASQAAADRDVILEEVNHRLEMGLLKEEEKQLIAKLHAKGISASSIAPSPRSNFNGFDYGAHAMPRAAAIGLAQSVLIFGLLHYISFYLLECIKVATHVFLPAIPIVNAIGFYGFIAFSIGCGIKTMLDHHDYLSKNTNLKYDQTKELTMDELKNKLAHITKNLDNQVNIIRTLTTEINTIPGHHSIELPPCVLKHQETPPFKPDSIFEMLYFFFTENMMGIFCGRALGVIATAMFITFTPTLFGPGIFAAILVGGLIYAGIQAFEKRQNQIKELIDANHKKEAELELVLTAKHNLSMTLQDRQAPATKGEEIAGETPSVSNSDHALSIETNVSSLEESKQSPVSTPSPPSPSSKTGSAPPNIYRLHSPPKDGQEPMSPKRPRSGSTITNENNGNDSPPVKRLKSFSN